MLAEEKRMSELRRKQDDKRDRELAAERKKDMEGGKEVVDQKYKALDYLLSQSKLYSSIMLQQMTAQEEAEGQKDEKSKKRAEKREENAEKAAQAYQKRATRGAAKTQDTDVSGEQQTSPTKELPRRGRPSKSKPTGKITDFVKKEASKPRLAAPPYQMPWQKRRKTVMSKLATSVSKS